MTTTIRPETNAVEFVLAEIRRDITDGIYEGADLLDSFTTLHDYCDANDYIIAATERFCPFPNDAESEEWGMSWQEWGNDLADSVDTLLHSDPIRL